MQHDVNASLFLVHQALSAAFQEPPEARASSTLEASLRQDIDRRLSADEDAP